MPNPSVGVFSKGSKRANLIKKNSKKHLLPEKVQRVSVLSVARSSVTGAALVKIKLHWNDGKSLTKTQQHSLRRPFWAQSFPCHHHHSCLGGHCCHLSCGATSHQVAGQCCADVARHGFSPATPAPVVYNQEKKCVNVTQSGGGGGEASPELGAWTSYQGIQVQH